MLLPFLALLLLLLIRLLLLLFRHLLPGLLGQVSLLRPIRLLGFAFSVLRLPIFFTPLLEVLLRLILLGLVGRVGSATLFVLFCHHLGLDIWCQRWVRSTVDVRRYLAGRPLAWLAALVGLLQFFFDFVSVEVMRTISLGIRQCEYFC